ncbi:hypothetical protein GCM10010478_13640 [Streptomyces erythrogriseus]|uniref:Transposase n=3 Tax=Streptomyces TaxID=1883 RepID=A0ABN3WHH0_9ACTN|nr:hypothetical protein GCM10010265_49060 [Streptomyces griseoincarnatus]GGT61355.1 hypothetical protein GCM10010287_39730 [Streptomyces variabilis]
MQIGAEQVVLIEAAFTRQGGREARCGRVHAFTKSEVAEGRPEGPSRSVTSITLLRTPQERGLANHLNRW